MYINIARIDTRGHKNPTESSPNTRRSIYELKRQKETTTRRAKRDGAREREEGSTDAEFVELSRYLLAGGGWWRPRSRVQNGSATQILSSNPLAKPKRYRIPNKLFPLLRVLQHRVMSPDSLDEWKEKVINRPTNKNDMPNTNSSKHLATFNPYGYDRVSHSKNKPRRKKKVTPRKFAHLSPFPRPLSGALTPLADPTNLAHQFAPARTATTRSKPRTRKKLGRIYKNLSGRIGGGLEFGGLRAEERASWRAAEERARRVQQD